MFFHLKQKTKVNEMEEQARGFEVSTRDYLIDNLVNATKNEMVDDVLLAEHARAFVATKKSLDDFWRLYMKLKEQFIKDDENLLRIAEQWRAYWESWFITSMNHYNPKELTKLAEEREKIIKEFEKLLKI